MSPARAEDGLVVLDDEEEASLRLRRAMVTALRQTVEVVLVRSMVMVKSSNGGCGGMHSEGGR